MFIVITTIGFGDIYPVTVYEVIFIIIFAMFSVSIFGYILNEINLTISELTQNEDQYR